MQKVVLENFEMPTFPLVNAPVVNNHVLACPENTNFVSNTNVCPSPQILASCGIMNIRYYCK